MEPCRVSCLTNSSYVLFIFRLEICTSITIVGGCFLQFSLQVFDFGFEVPPPPRAYSTMCKIVIRYADDQAFARNELCQPGAVLHLENDSLPRVFRRIYHRVVSLSVLIITM